MALLERDHDDAVIDGDRGAVGERPIVGARRHADIVDDQVQIFFRNDLADLVFDRLEVLLGRLDPGARRGAHVKLDHAAVDGRIEIPPHEDEQSAAEGEHDDRKDRDDAPPRQKHSEKGGVALA